MGREATEAVEMGITSRTAGAGEFLTTKELMLLLKIKHKQTIYGLIEEGMPALIVGKRNYRFVRREVLAFLREKSRKRIKI